MNFRTILKELRPTLALALPIMVGQLSQMLMGVTDSLMVGRLGAVPLAASAFVGVLFTAGFMVGIGVLSSVSVLVARTHGARQARECAEFLRHGMWLALFLSLAGAALIFALIPWLDLFGQPLEVIAASRPYLELIALSLFPTLLFQVLRQFSEAVGRPWGGMVILLASVALNVLLNWILIYGNWGAPALGLAGAGWATLASRIVSLVAIWCWLGGHRELHAEWPARRASAQAKPNPVWLARLSWRHLREMFALGVPVAAQLVFEGGAFAMASLMMGWIGTVPLAAHQIALNCSGFAFMAPLGLSIALSVRVGRALGEGRVQALRPIVAGAQGAGAAYALGSLLVFVLAGSLIASAFTPELGVVTLATQLLIVAALFQLFDGGQVIVSGALRGLADVKVPTVIVGVAYWLIGMPAAYLWGVRPSAPLNVWVGLAVALAIAALLLTRRLYGRVAQRELASGGLA